MKFVVSKTEAVICGTGKPFCPGTLCLMMQMGQKFWVALPTQPEQRQQLASCIPCLADGTAVAKGTRTEHYALTTTGESVLATNLRT